MSVKESQNGYMTSTGERLSYGLHFVGQNIYYVIFFLFLLTFMTDIGIPAFTVAAIMLVVKIWDAINDPIFGYLVDKIRFRKGKFKPWLKIGLLAIPATTILIFAIPSTIPLTYKIIWAVVAYILWDVAFTIVDVPILGLVTTMTDVITERTSILAIGRVAANIATILVAVVVPAVRQALGGWLPTVIVLSLVGLVTCIPIIATAKERIKPIENKKEYTVKDMMHYLFHNKYLLIFYAGWFIFNVCNYLSSALSLYFARYGLGAESKATFISLAVMLPAILMGIMLPRICKKVDKFVFFFWSVVSMPVVGILSYFVGYQNELVFLILTAIRSIPFGAAMVLTVMFAPDCAEYGRFRSGIYAPGITFALHTFTVKLIMALSTAIGSLALVFIGFIEGEGAIQLPGFNDKLWAVYILIPTFGALASIPVFSQYKLRDKTVQIMARCNAGEITREEADELLADKNRQQ